MSFYKICKFLFNLFLTGIKLLKNLAGEPVDHGAERRPSPAWRRRRQHCLGLERQPTVCHFWSLHDLVRRQHDTLVAERTSTKLCNFLRKPVWHLLTRLLSEEANIGDRWSLANGSEWAIHEKLYKLQLQILAFCKSKRASLTVIFFSWVRIRKEIETGLCKS